MAREDDEPLGCFDRQRLVAGRMARGDEDPHARLEFVITLDVLVAGAREVDPLGHRVSRPARRFEFYPLDDDGNAGEGAVLPAVVEVQMAMNDPFDRRGLDTGFLKRHTDVAGVVPEGPVHPVVAETDAGVVEDRASLTRQRVRVQHARPSGQRMAGWIWERRETQRHDVSSCSVMTSPLRSPARHLYSTPLSRRRPSRVWSGACPRIPHP